MPEGISLQMQDLFFSNSSFFLLQELFVPDLSGQNKTFSTLSELESQWQACGWQLCLKLLYFSFSKHVGHIPPTALTVRSTGKNIKLGSTRSAAKAYHFPFFAQLECIVWSPSKFL